MQVRVLLFRSHFFFITSSMIRWISCVVMIDRVAIYPLEIGGMGTCYSPGSISSLSPPWTLNRRACKETSAEIHL
jgi:hypothetical protein